jgi:hypothetical protein
MAQLVHPDGPHYGNGELPRKQERVGCEGGPGEQQLDALEDLEQFEEQNEQAAALAGVHFGHAPITSEMMKLAAS